MFKNKIARIGIQSLHYTQCFLKGLSFISNRQRWKENTFCASELAGIDHTARLGGIGYARLCQLG